MRVLRLLVTGGCGFVGVNLVARLAISHPAWMVRVFDNESLGRRGDLGAGFRGEFVRGDVRDADGIDRALEGMDAVVHLAADTRVMDSIADPAFNFDVNVRGGFTLLEAMRKAGVRRLVSASTGGAILGEAPPPVHEEMVARPMAPYGAGKLMMEGYCSAYTAAYGFAALSLRFSNVYGPRSFHKGSVVAAFFKRILRGEPLVVYGDGEQVRDYVFVDDLCDGIVAGLASPLSGVVQLGSGRPTSVNALIEALQRVTAPTLVRVIHEPARAGEIHATWCDIGKARRELGFHPATGLEEGLEQTWRWFRDQTALAA